MSSATFTISRKYLPYFYQTRSFGTPDLGACIPGLPFLDRLQDAPSNQIGHGMELTPDDRSRL